MLAWLRRAATKSACCSRLISILRTSGLARRASIWALWYFVPTDQVAMRCWPCLHGRRRFPMILCGVFAVAALALTLIALNAISLHEVLTRRREFGIRIALGAAPSMIRRLILNDAIRVSATGVVIGTIGAVILTRSIQTLLFGITASDWRVYLVVAATVVTTALLSSLAPALRAGAVSPSIAMRQE